MKQLDRLVEQELTTSRLPLQQAASSSANSACSSSSHHPHRVKRISTSSEQSDLDLESLLHGGTGTEPGTGIAGGDGGGGGKAGKEELLLDNGAGEDRDEDEEDNDEDNQGYECSIS